MTTTRTTEIEAARAADTRIAAAWDLYWAADAKLAPVRERIKSYRRFTSPEIVARREELLATLQARFAAEVAPFAEAARQLDADLYKGWTRFFLVEHIHSSQHCSSFRATTRVGWLPEVSGLTEAEAVAEHGAILCTICFPTAPVEYTRGPQADPATCAGSGKQYTRDLPHRLGFYGGNWVTCPDCGKQVGISRNGRAIPKHQAAGK